MNIREARHIFEHSQLVGPYSEEGLTSAYVEGLAALHEKEARENPQPLTLEQLREMGGQPVWIADLLIPKCSMWHLICDHPTHGLIAIDKMGQKKGDAFRGGYYDINAGYHYGETWLAYAYPPKEEADAH